MAQITALHMKKSIALLLPFFPFLLQSQIEPYLNILNDPDVIWAAELDLYFSIRQEQTLPDSSLEKINGFTPLKLVDTDPNSGNLLFCEKLLDLCRNGKQPAFNPYDENIRYDAAARREAIRAVDIITVIDPVTTMEYNRVVYNDPNAHSITGVRVKQLLFYREKSAEFDLYTAAFAPEFAVYTNTEPAVYLYSRMPLWFHMPPWSPKTNARRPDLQDPGITWACRMTTRKNMPALEELQPFKDFKPPVMQQLLDRFRHDPAYRATETLNGDLIPFENRESLIVQTDSMITFDPETYDERPMVLRTELTGYQLQHLCLSQDWFWDEKKQQLIIRLHAFAPMLERKDAAGDFLYWKALFWRGKRP